MKYEDFFTNEDVATFKRVKLGQMRLATVAREQAAGIVGGQIYKNGKEFVRTDYGAYRLAMAENSDNSTERFAHESQGVETVIMSNRIEMERWFADQGYPDSYEQWQSLVEWELNGVNLST